MGTDIRVNDPGGLPPSAQNGEEAPNCNIQSEVSMASWGDTLVAGWNDGSQCAKNILRRGGLTTAEGISLNGYGYSSDGGTTWTDGGLLPTPDGGGLFGDPVLSAGPGGVFYYAMLVEDTARRIGIARSTDGGKTWSLPVIASGDRPITPPPPPTSPLAARTTEDKPWIAVDTSQSPHRGNLYVAWTEVGAQPGVGDDDIVFFSRSVDGGLTFSDPTKLSVPVSYLDFVQERPGTGTQVAVGPGGEVYVAWVDLRSRSTIWLARSPDGGASFDLPRPIASVEPVGHSSATCGTTVLNGDIRIFNWISMAADTTGSSDPGSANYNPHRGNIYLAAAHDAGGLPPFPERLAFPGDESDIAWTYSTDGGVSWANVDDKNAVTTILNIDGTETDQFHPAVAVGADGRIAVSWYDRSVSESNWDIVVVARVSSDGGRTFGPTIRVSDDQFPPSRTNPNTGGFSNCYMGEYNGAVGNDGDFLLAWGDNRDGNDLHPDPNVYFDRITFGPSVVSGGDGIGEGGVDGGVGGDVGGDVGTGGGGSGGDGEEGGAYVQPDLGGTGETPTLVTARCGDQAGNHIVGTPAKDRLRGTPGPDVLCGLGGRDRLRGLGGDDLLIGGPGRDLLIGGRGADVCLGGAGRDRIRRCEA